MSKRSVICEAVRTPIGRFQGGLAAVRAPQLGAICVKAILERTGLDPAKVDEVIMGNVCQAGLQQNPARQASIYGGVPATVSAMTVNKVCGSGLKAVALADQAIRAGDRHCVIAGGMENMSQIPYALLTARDGLRLGDAKVTDLLVHDGLWDIYNDFHMGMTAEWVVDTYDVSPRRPGRLRRAQPPPRGRRLGPRASSRARWCRCRCPSARATRSWWTATRARAPTPACEALAKLKPGLQARRRHRDRRQRLHASTTAPPPCWSAARSSPRPTS